MPLNRNIDKPGPANRSRRSAHRAEILEKYRSFVRSIETDQPVGADYIFPPELTGDQILLQYVQETITKARLKIIEEIITSISALVGSESNEWGPLAIYESIVAEGTPIDEGFLILKSSVTPLGDGNAIKITVKYPLDLAMRQLLQKSLGQDNLIPQKDRRLVTHLETDTLVDTATYVFPSILTGDQTEVRYIEETMQRARLKIIEEIIATISSLVGSESNEWGPLIIDEGIVDDGTPIEEGYLILKSSVTPLGNGKSVKITVSYPLDLAMRVMLKRTLGQDNLTPAKYRRLVKTTETDSFVDPFTYVFPVALSGDETQISYIEETIQRARLKITEEVIDVDADPLLGSETDIYGPLSIEESIVDEGTAVDEGFLIKTSEVTPLGNGKAIKITVFYPDNLGDVILTRYVFDEEQRIMFPLTRQIVPADTIPSIVVDGVREELRERDIYRSERLLYDHTGITAVDSSTAILSSIMRPYTFPARLDVWLLQDIFVDFSSLAHQTPYSDLVEHIRRTWWVLSPTKPTISYTVMRPNDITVNGIRYPRVLHDAILLQFGFDVIQIQQTVPSFSEFTGSGTPFFLTGTIAVTAGSPDVVGTGTAFTTELSVGAELGLGWFVIDIDDDTHLTMEFDSLVSSSGVTSLARPNSGSGLIGTEVVIYAEWVYDGAPNLWKCVTDSVIMR